MREKAFAALVRERLMDVDDVKEALGFERRQSVRERVISGKIPEPIICKARGYSLWDRKVIEPLIGSFTRR